MDINNSNIKEISISDEFVINNDDKNTVFNEFVLISKNRISFVRKSNKKQYDKWDFKTNILNFDRKWEHLKRMVLQQMYTTKKSNCNISDTKFKITILFEDDNKVDLNYYGDFYSNELISLAELIKEMIPESVTDLPYVLAPFKLQNLTKNNFSLINVENISALMFAEGGAMGIPGIVELVDKDFNVYTANTMFDKNCNLTQIEVLELFNGLNPYEHFKNGDFSYTLINDEKWVYLYLGVGNHLFVRSDFYQLFGNRLFDVNLTNRYVKWCGLIRY